MLGSRYPDCTGPPVPPGRSASTPKERLTIGALRSVRLTAVLWNICAAVVAAAAQVVPVEEVEVADVVVVAAGYGARIARRVAEAGFSTSASFLKAYSAPKTTVGAEALTGLGGL